jgi:hypothetical protein
MKTKFLELNCLQTSHLISSLKISHKIPYVKYSAATYKYIFSPQMLHGLDLETFEYYKESSMQP